MKNFLKQKLDMTLLFMLEKNQMLKRFMLIRIFYVLGLNIFAPHFLTNGLRKQMGNLFLGNRIFHHNYLILFLGNYNIYEKLQHFIFFKKSSNHYNNSIRFIYCGNIELKNLQGPDVLRLLIVVDELNIHSLVSYIQEFLIEFLYQNPI